jgi:hypothetical protein
MICGSDGMGCRVATACAAAATVITTEVVHPVIARTPSVLCKQKRLDAPRDASSLAAFVQIHNGEEGTRLELFLAGVAENADRLAVLTGGTTSA